MVQKSTTAENYCPVETLAADYIKKDQKGEREGHGWPMMASYAKEVVAIILLTDPVSLQLEGLGWEERG